MAKKLSDIRNAANQFLKNEFAEGVEEDFKVDEINLYVSELLVEISENIPYEKKETLTTTVGSNEIDISTIEDLLEVDKIEYRTGYEPPHYHNCTVFGNKLRMEIDFTPSAVENVYLFCHKVHQLTEDSSTLSPQIESVLVSGLVAKVALSWINQIRTQVSEALAMITEVNTAVDNMSARITAAIGDLTSGRSLINKINKGASPQTDYANYAARELSNANTYLGQSQGYIREMTSRLSVSNLINTYQVWANNKLMLYHRDLKRLTKPRTYTRYPRT